MTADAAAILEEVFAERQSFRALKHAVLRVALLATRFHIRFFIERVQPEFIEAMRFFNTRRRAPVAVMARGAAEAVRIMNCQKLFIRMADESFSPIVRLFAWPI